MNIVSVSWGDHLSFGEGDGRLETPDALERRVRVWRDELGAGILHWRALRTRIPGKFSAARGYRHPSQISARAVTWDDLASVPTVAHQAGLEAWLYVSVFDEGWPLARPAVRARSHHNAMHGQHVAWQSTLTRTHPEWLTVDRSGRRRQQGVVSLSRPEARQAFIDRWRGWLDGTAFDGVFVCLRSQSRPADHGDQFGFDPQARRDFSARHGVDPAKEGFDGQAWRDLQGEYLTALIEELRATGLRVGVGVARGDVIGPPLGNATLHWRDWLRRGLVDHLVVDQHSSQCPSMWHQLWPMHRGAGYLQNYLTGDGLPPLTAHLREVYGPVAQLSQAKLCVARQWQSRSTADEQAIAGVAGVSGLVFSSFRHDNPAAIDRGDWSAGRL